MMSAIHKPVRFFSLLLALLLAIVSLTYKSCDSPSDKLSDNATQTTSAATKAVYVGSEACISCHADAAKTWAGSHHDHAMAAATQETVLGDFNNVTVTSRGVSSRFFQQDGKYFANTEGPDGASHDYEILYTFGVAPLQQYLVSFPNGRLQALRMAWDTQEQKWFDLYPDTDISPSEWLHWSRGAMNWNSMCADCHSTKLEKNFDLSTGEYHTTWEEINVSCESCHGPGQQHIEYVSETDYAKTENPVPGHFLHLTSANSSIQQVNQCGRCHARRTLISESGVPEGDFLNHYIPELLRDATYHADGQIQDEVYVFGSFTQSKMYHNGVKCTDCHDAHSLNLKYEKNLLCTQCHEPSTFDTKEHHFHPMQTAGSECINCHMTGKNYMVNDFRRDHSFRIPRPDQSVAFGTPNACTGCHTEKSPEWASKAVETWYGPERKPHFSDALTQGRTRSEASVPSLITLARNTTQPAIARATAVLYLSEIATLESYQTISQLLGDSSSLVRYTAVNALGDLPPQDRLSVLPRLLRDTVKAVRIATANALADIPPAQMPVPFQADQQKALSEFQVASEIQADFPSGQLMLGQFYQKMGRASEAEEAYLKALTIDSLFNMARINLATLYNGLQRNQEGIQQLKTVIMLEPEYGPAYYSLGLLYAEENRLEEATKYLKQAAIKVGNNPRIYYNWGLALQHQEKTAEAESAYLEGLKVDSQFPALHNALAILYLQSGKATQARYHAEFLVSQFPDNPQFQQLLQQTQGGS